MVGMVGHSNLRGILMAQTGWVDCGEAEPSPWMDCGPKDPSPWLPCPSLIDPAVVQRTGEFVVQRDFRIVRVRRDPSFGGEGWLACNA